MVKATQIAENIQKVADAPTSTEGQDTPYSIRKSRNHGQKAAIGRYAASLIAEGVHPEAGITNINAIELPTKKAILQSAKTRVVLADTSKLGYRAVSHVCHISDIDMIVTDKKKTDKAALAYQDKLRYADI